MNYRERVFRYPRRVFKETDRFPNATGDVSPRVIWTFCRKFEQNASSNIFRRPQNTRRVRHSATSCQTPDAIFNRTYRSVRVVITTPIIAMGFPVSATFPKSSLHRLSAEGTLLYRFRTARCQRVRHRRRARRRRYVRQFYGNTRKHNLLRSWRTRRACL